MRRAQRSTADVARSEAEDGQSVDAGAGLPIATDERSPSPASQRFRGTARIYGK